MELSGDRAHLQRFAAKLEHERFRCALAEAAEIPVDTLLVVLGNEDEGEWRLELSLVPGMESELEGTSILQCFVPVILELDPAFGEGVRAFVTLLNTRLPLVGFVHLEHERIAGFRYMLLLPNETRVADALVVQTTWLIAYLMSVFGAALLAVGSGAPARAALAETPFAGLFP